ncbi:uncharacterized protein LODBEIA_P31970 [Lodderomyces beijingensis]|uniref:Transcription initiation factor TFIID subunit 12 domain-containing protein n=1 Tax=Lodderomyces beijingensis TaxID=1775926 RepID=A0ABP0ZMT5_9ASCO
MDTNNSSQPDTRPTTPTPEAELNPQRVKVLVQKLKDEIAASQAESDPVKKQAHIAVVEKIKRVLVKYQQHQQQQQQQQQYQPHLQQQQQQQQQQSPPQPQEQQQQQPQNLPQPRPKAGGSSIVKSESTEVANAMSNSPAPAIPLPSASSSPPIAPIAPATPVTAMPPIQHPVPSQYPVQPQIQAPIPQKTASADASKVTLEKYNQLRGLLKDLLDKIKVLETSRDQETDPTKKESIEKSISGARIQLQQCHKGALFMRKVLIDSGRLSANATPVVTSNGSNPASATASPAPVAPAASMAPAAPAAIAAPTVPTVATTTPAVSTTAVPTVATTTPAAATAATAATAAAATAAAVPATPIAAVPTSSQKSKAAPAETVAASAPATNRSTPNEAKTPATKKSSSPTPSRMPTTQSNPKTNPISRTNTTNPTTTTNTTTAAGNTTGKTSTPTGETPNSKRPFPTSFASSSSTQFANPSTNALPNPPPQFTIPDNDGRVLTKRKLNELMTRISIDQGDVKTSVDNDVEELFLDLADEFVRNVMDFSCTLAKHRKLDRVDIKDVQLHLERNWGIKVAGYMNDDIKPIRKWPKKK